jgi:hypothetical protein
MMALQQTSDGARTSPALPHTNGKASSTEAGTANASASASVVITAVTQADLMAAGTADVKKVYIPRFSCLLSSSVDS